MNPIRRITTRPHSRLAALAIAAGLAAGLSASPAMAAPDAGLDVHLSDAIIASGDTVDVRVSSYFPAFGYALARVSMDVNATDLTWLSATSGVIAGPTVQGAFFHQDHDPAAGLLANPANPITIWGGRYRPNTPGPAFIPISAQPDFLSFYPHAHEAEDEPWGEPKAGHAWLMVDPFVLPEIGFAAPGAGTSLEPIGSGGGGRLVAQPDDDGAILIGLLLPAVQKVREAASRSQPPADASLVSRTYQVRHEAAAGDSLPVDSLTFNFSPIKGGMYELDIDTSLDLAGTLKCLIGPHGELICQMAAAPVRFGRVPSCLRFTIETDDVTGGDELVLTPCDDEPLLIELPGEFKGLVDADSLSIRLTPSASASGRPLRFDGIAGESIDMAGLPAGSRVEIDFAPDSKACPADLDGDGALTVFDFLAFQNLFSAGDLGADFDGDGQLSLFDFLAFQNAFAAGCP